MSLEVKQVVLKQIAEVHAIAERMRELAVSLRAEGIDVRIAAKPSAADPLGMEARVCITMDTQMRPIGY